MRAGQLIEALFCVDLGDDERVALVTDTGDGFKPYPYQPYFANLIDGQGKTWYVCGSTIRKQDPLRRRKQDCVRGHVFLLDDIGTKAKAPSTTPSAVLETSEGNFQWLYRLDPPTEDFARFQALQKAMAKVGHNDGGAIAGGPQLFRVPGSVKPKVGFTTRVVEFDPDLCYDLEELIEAFGVDVEPFVVHTISDLQSGTGIPRGDNLWNWLLDHDQVLSDASSDGWYKVLCPWRDKHSDPDDPVAKYSPLGEGDKAFIRGFLCFHAHCRAQTIEHFVSWAEQQSGLSFTTGPTEVPSERMRELVADVSMSDRMVMLAQSLPEIESYDLPDVRFRADGELALSQPVTIPNLVKALADLGLTVRQNASTHQPAFVFSDPEDPLLAMLAGKTAQTTFEAVRVCALDRLAAVGLKNKADLEERLHAISVWDPFSSICEWVDSKPWDGTSRFEELAATVEADDGDVWRMYLRRWLIQAIQAWHNWVSEKPKRVEHVLVLAGVQGSSLTDLYKTRWLESLVRDGDFTSGIQLQLGKSSSGDRDNIRAATSTPLGELGELETTFSATQSGALKNYLSRDVDVYRLSYGRTEVRYPRTTCYAATVNNLDFLVDMTGSKRYWPVHALSTNPLHGLDIQQVWAEAKTWWAAGEQWWLTPEEETQRVDRAGGFTFVDSVTERVRAYLDSHSRETWRVMNCETFLEYLQLPTINNTARRRCTEVLNERLGKRRQINGVRNAWKIPMGAEAKRFPKGLEDAG